MAHDSSHAGQVVEERRHGIVAKAVVDRHYRNLADNYDRYLVYSGDFPASLAAKMIDMLRLGANDVLVDLAGGTGIYSIEILKQKPLRNHILLVDPFPEMLAKVPRTLPISTINMDAHSFAERPGAYDKILIKEAIHHIADRRRLFANLFRRLKPGGALLLVHVPPELDYPLFDAALARSLTWHADPDELVDHLAEAGFQVERDRLVYRHAIAKDEYFDMVRGRYMSLLTAFSDAELDAGLAEMERRYADVDVLNYDDRFDYIVGRKPAG